MWALRDIASLEGHYSSPAKASVFFGQLADEISDACVRGKLECKPQLISEMPPVNWSDVVTRLPSRYARAFDMIILTQPPLQFNASSGSEYLLAASLRFLNYPVYSPPSGTQDLAAYTMNGWYYRSGSEWFSVKVRAPNEALMDARVERRA